MLERKGNVSGNVDHETTDVRGPTSGLVGEGACEGGRNGLTYLSHSEYGSLPI
jgi:hypothetical protein